MVNSAKLNYGMPKREQNRESNGERKNNTLNADEPIHGWNDVVSHGSRGQKHGDCGRKEPARSPADAKEEDAEPEDTSKERQKIIGEGRRAEMRAN